MNYSVKDIVARSFVSTPYEDRYSVKELWSGEEFETDDVIKTKVNGHGVKIYKVRSL